MSLPEYVTVNGTSYAINKLPEDAKLHVVNVQVVDAEIARLQQQLAIAQTARKTYVAALIEVIQAKGEAQPAEKVKKPRAPRKKKAAE